jgi:flagellar motor switch protein FliN/FliY
MAEENDAQEIDVEAEMLRMKQEELGGEEDSPPADAAEPAAEGAADSLLEEEMFRSMEQKTPGGEAASATMGALSSSMGGGGSVTDYGEEAEGVDKLSDVDVELTVELGENLIPIQDIMTWKTGSVVELQVQEHEPVNVMLNGSPFAKGEIVVVGDTFGLRIIELLDPEESTH